MADKQTSLQDLFLNALRKSKTPVTMFLVKGVKLQGIVTWFDNFSVLLRRDGQSQLIYKHAISTVMPAHPIDLAPIEKAFAESKRGVLLQEIFLNAVKQSGDPVTMFLVNGFLTGSWAPQIPLVLTRIPESYGPRARLDTPGLVLVTAAALGIVWALMRGNDVGWGSAETVATLAERTCSCMVAGRVKLASDMKWVCIEGSPSIVSVQPSFGLGQCRGYSPPTVHRASISTSGSPSRRPIQFQR